MSAASPNVGQVIGHYRILERIGAGGMGVVFRARDQQLNRDVALKVLAPGTLADNTARKRFHQEAEALARLNHPNVATVYEFFTNDSVDYLVTEYIPGITLDAKLKEGPLTEPEILRLGVQLTEGLDDAHQQGVVHRDLKPANLRITQTGRLKILDFGLARFVESEGDLMQSGTVTCSRDVTGTLPYMAPEQLQGRPADTRTDLWAAGAVLYEMTTGRRAFPEPSTPLLVDAILHKTPQAPNSVNPQVSTTLTRVILKSLNRDPAQRYQSAQELQADLQRLTIGLAPTAAPGRHRLWVAGATLVLIVALGAYFIVRRQKPAPSARTRPSVAVLGFKNLSGNAGKMWLSTALSEMLTTDLAAGEQLRTVSSEDVARAKIDLSLSDSDSYAKDTLSRLRKSLNTDYVVLGSYLDLVRESGGQIRLDIHLQDAAAGETTASISETGTEENLLELVSRAGTDLRRKLGVSDVSPDDVAGIRASLPSNSESARLYSEGLLKLRLFDALNARTMLERAVAADPNYALAHSALADAWATLGYDERSQREAKRAFELSANLPREERLWVEGRYREIIKDWSAAIDRYRTLFSFSPDNVEYGLRLIQAQTKGGKPADARTILQSLRALPPPARDDPRIDLAEASVQESLGDFKQEQLAASRATSKGREQGARLVTARALRTEAWSFVNLGQNDEATKKAKEAEALYEAAGDRNGVAAALNVQGTVLLNQGDYVAANRIYAQELDLYREIGNKSGVALALNNTGAVLIQQGDLAGASRILAQTLAVFREIGDRYSEAYSLNNMAAVLTNEGDLRQARRLSEQALAIFQEIEEKDGTAYAWVDLGTADLQLGNLLEAEKSYKMALNAARQTGDKGIQAYALYGLGDISLVADNLPQAQKWYSDSLTVRSDMGDKQAAAESRTALAEVAIEEGRPSDAEPSVRDAREEFRRQKASDDEITATAILIRALRLQGKMGEALKEIDATRPFSVKTQNPSARLKFVIEMARVRLAAAQLVDARRDLDAAFAEASRTDLRDYQLESRLAMGEADLRSGHAASGRANLATLEKEAHARGYILIARKAGEVRSSRSFLSERLR